jgi:uncharacterized protein (TIGR02996 family)
LLELDLGNTNIGSGGLMFLAHSPHIGRLQTLHLRYSGVGDAGIVELARSPLARSLVKMDLTASDLTTVGAWELVHLAAFECLEEVNLWDCDNLTDSGCLALHQHFGKRVALTLHGPKTEEELHLEEEEDESLPGPKPTTPSPPLATAFLDDIRQHPDDDAPRLVYADWLEENGDAERAEFIRVQCRLAQLPSGDPEGKRLAKREKKLLQSNARRWTEESFLGWLDHPSARCPIAEPHGVCRIFSEAVRLRLEAEAPRVSAKRKREIEEKLDECEEHLEAFNFSGYECRLPLFNDFTFHRGFIERAAIEEMMFFLFAPAVRDLGMVRYLEVVFDETEPDVGDRLIDRLVTVMDAPRLRTLHLNVLIWHAKEIETLAAWPGLSELTELHGIVFHDRERNEDRSDDVVCALARSPWPSKLKSLQMNLYPDYTDDAINSVLDSTTLAQLERLRLVSDEPRLSESVLARYRARFVDEHPDHREE